MRHRKLRHRFISVLLICVLLVTNLVGCGKQTEEVDNNGNVPEINTEELVHEMVSEIQEDIEKDNSTEDIVEVAERAISDNWEDYVGDVETFVYGLLCNELGYKYDVFPAYVELSNGIEIGGIAYTDYQDCYVNEDETQSTFIVGMIPYVGECVIPQEEFDEGLVVYNADYSDTETTFILGYTSEAFANHCVVYNQYLKYGVNSDGIIYYESSDYSEDIIDKELGTLYSYDEQIYLYDVDFDDRINLTGESLSTQLDYAEIEKEINRVLAEQDINFAQVDIESYAYASQEAITNYFLSMQEETFLRYPVSSLVEIANDLDPLQCIRITDEGLAVIDIEQAPKEGEEALVKWLVGTGCVILAAVGMVGAVVFVECPPLSALSGAIAGVAIEVFMQVVINNEKLDEIDWTKVAIAATMGAVSGFLGPYIMATYGGATYFVVDSALDGLLGAIEQTVYAWMEGASGIEMIKSFGFGFTLGFCLSAGFKGVGAVVGKIAKKVGPSISKAGEKIFPKLSGKVSNITKTISSKMYALKRAADSSVFHSKYISKKLALKQIEQLALSGSNELKDKAFRHLQGEGILDADGNPISKESLEKVFDKAKDGEIIGHFKLDGEIINIKKQNGMVGISFDESKYLTVELPNGIRNNGDSADNVKRKFRRENFEDAATEMQKIWAKNPESIPESIADALKAQNIDIEDALPGDIVTIVQDTKNGWVMHENIDMKTITLVPRALHDVAKGGIAHMGGFGLAGYVKNHMGQQFFDRFVSAAATEVVIEY